MPTIESTTERDLAFNPNDLDRSVVPGNDFYHFAVGSWLKNHPIPDDQSRWGIFDVLTEYTNTVLKKIIVDPAPFAGTADASLAQKVSDLYAAGMDLEKINTQGITPLQPWLAKVQAVATTAELLGVVGELHRSVSRPMFGFYATPDAKNSEQIIVGLVQGGLGLPERDYYLATDERSVTIRQKYLEHMERLFVLSGQASDAKQLAARVMALETALATHMMPKEELRDPVKNYNKMEYAALQQRFPNVAWANYFVALGLPSPGAIDVGQLCYFDGLNNLITTIPLDDWKVYLSISCVRGVAEFLSAPFEEEKFAFYGQFMNGLMQMKPRDKRVVEVVDDCMGKALGKLYVRDNFSPIAKERAVQLVHNLRAAMEQRIKNVDWMEEVTKQEALTKLHAITVKIGYPDVWYSYDTLSIDPALSYVENVMRCSAFEMQRELAKIGKPVDRTEWLMHPQQVNAYYEPSKNEIVFPAGILQPPFFDDSADDAMNYGGIGAVIGHEISHGFDDQGRQFDAQGNLRDWWTPTDQAKFKERAMRLVQQYNSFELLPGLFVNGEFTLGENIADLGGVEIALDGFMLTDESKSGELIDGFTPLQRFFLSYAQTWKTNVREAKARMYIKVDPHSPGVFRTNGPLGNVNRFYDIFELSPTHTMYRAPDTRVTIW